MAIIDNIISLFGRRKPHAEDKPCAAAAGPEEPEPAEAPAPSPPLFCGDRIFYQSGFRNQDPGWYFYTRGGLIRGPYLSRGLAQAHLDTFIAHCQKTHDTGGRAHTRQSGGPA